MVEKGHKITNVLLILKVCDGIFWMMSNQILHNRPFLEVFRGGLEMAGYVFIIESFVEVLYEYLLDSTYYNRLMN
jgi:hypothetical protein